MAIRAKKGPTPKRPRWFLYYTGGVLTVGGLGWPLLLSMKERSTTAIYLYSAGFAGVCLMNTAIVTSPGPISKWAMSIVGGTMAAFSFGYVALTVEEHRKSAMISCVAAAMGYSMCNFVIFDLCGNEKKRKRIYDRLSNKEIFDMVDAANARFHYMGSKNQCEFCKAHVAKVIRERREAAAKKQSKALNAKVGFWGILWQYARKIFLPFGRAKNRDSPAAKKESKDGLKQEISKIPENKNMKELGNGAHSGKSVETVHKPAPAVETIPRPMNLSTNPAHRVYYDYSRGSVIVPDLLPELSSTQTEDQRVSATETEQSRLSSLIQEATVYMEDADSLEEDYEDAALVECEWYNPSVFERPLKKPHEEYVLHVPALD